MLGGAGALNADKLSLDLQFAADKTLTARKGPTPTFTRASTATFVGSDGLIQSAAINTARFDHDPVTLACKGLLIEEQRTNLSLYSEALVLNTGWTGLITSTVSGTGPNGGVAYELAESTLNVLQTFANTGGVGSTGATSITSGVTYTGSIFLKKISGSVDWVQITLASAGFGASQYANINLSNGSIGNSSGGTARVEAHANGWYRVSWTVVAGATTTTSLNVVIGGIQNTNGTNRIPIYIGSASNRFLAAMCQFEAGSFPTSYIPTTTAALTRSADVCSITGSDFSGFYNPVEGSFATSQIFNVAPVGQVVFDANDTTTLNRTRAFRLATTGVTGYSNTVGGTQDVFISGSSSISAGVVSKFASCMKANDFRIYFDSVLQGVDTVAAMQASPTTLTIGDASAGAPRAILNGTIASIRYFKKRLSDAKLQSLTA
jgi:hypothetical protein